MRWWTCPAFHSLHVTGRRLLPESVCQFTASGPVASPSLGVHVLKLSVLAGAGMVVDWEQETGLLMTSGDVRVVRIWDTDREMKVQVLNTHTCFVFFTVINSWKVWKTKEESASCSSCCKILNQKRLLLRRWLLNSVSLMGRKHAEQTTFERLPIGHSSVLPFYSNKELGFVCKVEIGAGVARQTFSGKKCVVLGLSENFESTQTHDV